MEEEKKPKPQKPIVIEYQEPEQARPAQSVQIETIFGKIAQVSSAPTWTPKTFGEQFAYYKSGATIRLYTYGFIDNAWHYVALT